MMNLFESKDILNHMCEFMDTLDIIKNFNYDFIYICDRVIKSNEIIAITKNPIVVNFTRCYFENYIIGQNLLFLGDNKVQYLEYKIKESKCISPKILFTINILNFKPQNKMECYYGFHDVDIKVKFDIKTHKKISFISNFIYAENIDGNIEVYWNNGDVYKGMKQNGYGNYHENGVGLYKGNFINFMKDGYGEFYYDKGDIYKGYFKNDCKNGYGEYYWPDGDIFKGNFKDDLKEGYGEYYFNDGCSIIGKWKDNEPDGYITYTWVNGDKCEGIRKSGSIHWEGIYTWVDGSYSYIKFNGDAISSAIKSKLKRRIKIIFNTVGDKILFKCIY